jgi:hypothetical protein
MTCEKRANGAGTVYIKYGNYGRWVTLGGVGCVQQRTIRPLVPSWRPWRPGRAPALDS